MIHDIPIMRSLDPHHTRLGYLGALATVSFRTLDTYDALVARFRDLLFERLHPEEPEFASAMNDVAPEYRKELLERMVRDAEEDPAAILSPINQPTGWLTRSEFWLYDKRMPSSVGYLSEKHAGRTVDLARWTGVLLPTLELSESGAILKHLVSGLDGSPRTHSNLLLAQARPGLALLYLRLLLGSEILFPCLISEFAKRQELGQAIATRGEAGLLRAAILRLLEAIGEPTDPEDVLTFRELRDFNDSVLRSGSTEDNYLRPRLEMLVDLGLVSRRPTGASERPGRFLWSLPPSSVALATAWRSVLAKPQSMDEFLESSFMSTVGTAFGLSLREPVEPIESLYWFVMAYSEIHRNIGFTPGRSIALLASLLAAEAGIAIEIKDFFDLAYSLPTGPFGEFVSFSGGSRFDTEFMVKLDLAGIRAVEPRLAVVNSGGQ